MNILRANRHNYGNEPQSDTLKKGKALDLFNAGHNFA
jgi:hypothetical protein